MPKETVLTLYRGFPNKQRYTWSPFANKLEFRFRYDQVSYDAEQGNPTQAPKQRIPYVDLLFEKADEPKLMGDSTLITEHLVKQKKLTDLNASLSPTEKLSDLAIRALCEDKLHQFSTLERWYDNYSISRDKIFEQMSWPTKIILGKVLQRRLLQTVQGLGLTAHSQDELVAIQRGLWQSLNDALQVRQRNAPPNEPYWILGGAEPTEADATVFGYAVTSLEVRSSPDTTRFIHGLSALMDYVERIHAKYYPDFERWDSEPKSPHSKL